MQKNIWKYFCLKYLYFLPKKILFTLFLVLLLFLVYGIFPNRWYHVLYIYSGSMQPTFSSGDLIVITPKPDALEPGMVLTMNVNGQLVTHRLIGLKANGALLTKGDNNSVVDDWDNTAVKVVGLYRFKIPYLGYLVDLMDVFSPNASGAWFRDVDSIDLSVATGNKSEKVQGTSISVNLTAAGSFDQNSNSFAVNGEVCVSNQGEVNTDGLQIFGQVEYKGQGGGKYQPLSDAVFYYEPSEVLQPGETRCYAYTILFEPVEEAHYRLSAQVFINNHSGWISGGAHCGISEICPFGPTAKSEFELPETDSTDEGSLNLLVPEPSGTPTPSVTLESTPSAEITETPDPSAAPDNPSETPADETITPEPTENVSGTPEAADAD